VVGRTAAAVGKKWIALNRCTGAGLWVLNAVGAPRGGEIANVWLSLTEDFGKNPALFRSSLLRLAPPVSEQIVNSLGA
jgi:hypothetical protein